MCRVWLHGCVVVWLCGGVAWGVGWWLGGEISAMRLTSRRPRCVCSRAGSGPIGHCQRSHPTFPLFFFFSHHISSFPLSGSQLPPKSLFVLLRNAHAVRDHVAAAHVIQILGDRTDLAAYDAHMQLLTDKVELMALSC